MKYENSQRLTITLSDQLIRDYFSADPITREKSRRYVEEIVRTALINHYIELTMDDGTIYVKKEECETDA